MNFFTNFGTEMGPDIGQPANVGASNPSPVHWVGEMDPGKQNPLNLDSNLVDMPVTDQTMWGIPTGEHFGGSLI